VGDTLEGTVVVRRKKGGVFVDIGSEVNALLGGAHPSEFAKLDLNEKLNGLTVERVDVDKKQIDVSFAGLSDLVADRPSRGFRQIRKSERNADQESLKTVRLDGKDLGPGEKKGMKLKLVGGLELAGVDDNGTVTLLLHEEMEQEKKKNNLEGKIDDPFEGFKPKQTLLGTIRSRTQNGAFFADIGAKISARIVGPEEEVRLLRWGEKLDLVIKTIKRDKGQADVIVPGLAARVAGRAAKLTELKDVDVPSFVTGVVEGKTSTFKGGFRGGVLWVDFGASVSARVQLASRKLWQATDLGARVKFKVEEVDLKALRVEGFLK
jgi:hypothetical protein